MSTVALLRDPYPHFVRDDALSPQILSDIRRNWPGRGYFVGEIPGNYVTDLTLFNSEGFWNVFTYNFSQFAIYEALDAFADQIRARYPDETNFFVHNYSLMQSRGDYGGHDVHNHHYHDPTWIATILLYVDEAHDGHSGTTILKTRAGLDDAEIAARTLQWHDLTEECSTVEYKAGRVFCFYDNPIAYHSVGPSKDALFGRRIVRLHIGAAHPHCERLYGVDYETYQKIRLHPSKDERVVSWMRRDIDEMRSARVLGEEEKMAWLKTVNVTFRHIKKAEEQVA